MSHRRPPPHAARTQSGIELPDPDQGEAYVQIQFVFPSTMLMAYEPFEDGTPGGSNVIGLGRRWAAWVEGAEPHLQVIEARFGHPMLIPRSAIPHVAGLLIAYHRREDVRAGHRAGGLAVPIPGGGMLRQLGGGALEIAIPR